MKLELWLFFECIAMIMLFVPAVMNRRGSNYKITYVIPLLGTVLFGIMMFAPITSGGRIDILNYMNTSDNITYSYSIIESESYFTTLLLNFIFFMFSIAVTIYSFLLTATDYIEGNT